MCREIKALQESEENHHVSGKIIIVVFYVSFVNIHTHCSFVGCSMNSMQEDMIELGESDVV